MPACEQKDTYGYLGHEPEALREQLVELKATLERIARAQGAEAAKALDEAARDALNRASILVDDLSRHAEQARKSADAGRHVLEDAIRAEPLIAVSIAAVAGFLLATLGRRR